MDKERVDEAVQEWLRLDQDQETRSEILALRNSASYDELALRFSSRIAFGTAGLRAQMQGGTAFFNSLIVLQTTQGLARYACDNIEGARERGVVVGHDHRWRSKKFAQLAAGVFRREGMKVFLFEGLVHTPMVPFASARLKTALGIMLTASHNPAVDNGYKVYWSNSVQIIPPHDAGIAACIDKSLEVSNEAWIISDNPDAWKGTEQMKAAYFGMIRSLSLHRNLNITSPLVFTYTAMHGVGLPFAKAAFEAFGFPASSLAIVAEQANPDPAFPTLRFPNPEEKGALELAIVHADGIGSRIVLANDPDADRFCAAEKTSEGWKIFTGDQLGTLLGSWALRQHQQSGKPTEKLAMCASTVSSKMLRAMAKLEGFTFRETLTGFKYLGNESLELTKEGFDATFAYEEAIGFMCGTAIRDKDGVSALVTFCELAAALERQGKSVSAYLDDLYIKYGFFKTSNSYFVCRDPAKTDRIFFELRYGPSARPNSSSSPVLAIPKTLGGFAISYLRDLTVGYDSSNPPSFTPSLPVDPKSHMISFGISNAGEGVEVTGTVRTSGTEPKIKFYLEASGNNRVAVEVKLEKVRQAIGNEWLRWQENGLESA